MTIFANGHIFLKMVIFAKYDKKKKPMCSYPATERAASRFHEKSI